MIDYTSGYAARCPHGRHPIVIRFVEEGITGWCRQCRTVHTISMDDLPCDVLRNVIKDAENALARKESEHR